MVCLLPDKSDSFICISRIPTLPYESNPYSLDYFLPLQVFRFLDGSGHSSLLDVVVTKMIISEDYDGFTVDDF